MKDDFEQEIRDALRRADSVAIPVTPLDPDEVAALASRGHRVRLRSGTARRMLALAASVVLVVGVGLAAWSWLGRSKVVAAVPSFGLGFRGFVVTPSDPSLPVLRIVPKTVYSTRAGSDGQIEDPEENFYNRVFHALRPLLPDGVPEALPTTTPTIPKLTASMPAKLGDTATWTLAAPDTVSASSTSLTVNVTRLGCAGGKTGAVLEPTFSTSDTQIIIRANVKPITGLVTCQGNDSVQVTMTLDEPIGARDLLDAACLEGDTVRTAPCSGGAIRWTP